MNDLKVKLNKLIEERKDELISLTQKLVQFPSTIGNEEEIQEYIAYYLKDFSDEIDIWKPDIEEMKKHPDFSSDRKDFDTSPILVAKFKGAGGGNSLILNSHVDVVPEGIGWTESPWSGKVADGKIFGRGSTDMKSGLAASVFALKMIKEMGIQLKGDVLVETVVDEEVGSMGTLAAIIRGYKADAAIVPECTDLQIATTTIGSTWVRIKIKGKSAVLGAAHLGVSAIKKAMYIVDKLEEFEAKRTKELAHDMLSYIPTPFKINVGKFNSGNWPSSIPDSATLEIRFGMSPNETVQEAKDSFEKFIYNISQEDEWLKQNLPVVEWLGTCWHPGSVDADEAIVKALQENVKSVLNKEIEPIGLGAAADTAILTKHGIPAVMFGPGKVSQAHQKDEYVEIEDLVKATKVISSTVLDWCEYVE